MRTLVATVMLCLTCCSGCQLGTFQSQPEQVSVNPGDEDSASAGETIASTTKLEVEVTGVDGDAGHLLVALYDDPEGWSKDMDSHRTENAFQVQKPEPATETMTVLFELASGEYAISLFHDEDDSGTIALNFLSLPTESYGFSNNYNPVTNFGAPDFSDCQFEVVEGETTRISIQLRSDLPQS